MKSLGEKSSGQPCLMAQARTLMVTLSQRAGKRLPNPGLRGYIQSFLSIGDQHRSTTIECPRNPDDERQRRHVFAALDFAHVRAFDTREIRQGFLSNALSRSGLAHCRPKGKRWLGFKCLRPG